MGGEPPPPPVPKAGCPYGPAEGGWLLSCSAEQRVTGPPGKKGPARHGVFLAGVVAASCGEPWA